MKSFVELKLEALPGRISNIRYATLGTYSEGLESFMSLLKLPFYASRNMKTRIPISLVQFDTSLPAMTRIPEVGASPIGNDLCAFPASSAIPYFRQGLGHLFRITPFIGEEAVKPVASPYCL